MQISACPTSEQLLAFATGRMPDDLAETVAAHLDACSSCETSIAALERRDDSFIAELRQPLGDPQFLAEPECDEALRGTETFSSQLLTETADEVRRPAPTAARELPMQSLRDYQLIEQIGAGGMGTVYKAVHGRLKKLVAVKLLPAERMQDASAVVRFKREMEAVGKLEHVNIVRAMDAGLIDDTHFLVMEFVDGIDLSTLQRQCGGIAVPDAVELARQVAEGLSHIHAHGLVHRDIKPSNAMLTADGKVKILDLGLALLHDEPAPESPDELAATAPFLENTQGHPVTATGQAMGTADYMAPEQVADCHNVDIRADIYSLGCTLFKLLSGSVAFRGPQYANRADMLRVRGSEPAPRVREKRAEIPAGLDAVVARMMSPRPENRYRDPRQLAAALAGFAAGNNLPRLFAKAHPEGAAASNIVAGDTNGVRSATAPSPSEDASWRRKTYLWPSLGPWKWPAIATGLVSLAAAFVLAAVTILIRDGDRTVQVRAPDGSKVEVDVTDKDNLKVEVSTDGAVTVAAAKNGSKHGWWRTRYDLGGTSFYPHPTTRKTSDRLEAVSWKPERVLGKISHVLTGDIDGNGRLEMVVRDADTVAAFDTWGKELWRRSPLADSDVPLPANRVGKVSRLELADVHQDGTLEVILLTGSESPEGWSRKGPQRALIYNGDGQVHKTFPIPDGGNANPQKCFDFNGDGHVDIVFYTGTYRHPHAVCVYDSVTGASLFRADFADGPVLAGVGDVTGNGKPELYLTQEFDCHVDPPVGDYDSDHCYATLFDLQGNRLWKATYPNLIDGCLADMNGDNRPEIILHHELPTRGSVHVLDPKTGEVTKTYSGLAPACGRCWTVANLSGDERRELVIGDGQQLHVIDADMQRVATTPGPQTRVAASNDLNGDGQTEIVVWQAADLIVLRGDLTELARHRAAAPIHEVIVTDIEGDGVNDVIMRSGTGEQIGLEIVHFAPLDPQTAFDPAEPSHVARAFLAAIRGGADVEMLAHVEPARHRHVRRLLKAKQLPTIPVDVPFAQSVHVDDAVINVDSQPRMRLTMRFAEERWWITGISWGDG